MRLPYNFYHLPLSSLTPRLSQPYRVNSGGLPICQFSGAVCVSLELTLPNLDCLLKIAYNIFWAGCQFLAVIFSHFFLDNHSRCIFDATVMHFKLITPFILLWSHTHTILISPSNSSLDSLSSLCPFQAYLFCITVWSDSVPICFSREV